MLQKQQIFPISSQPPKIIFKSFLSLKRDQGETQANFLVEHILYFWIATDKILFLMIKAGAEPQ